MGFLDGIGELLGGFNAQRRIDTEGFDWREQAAQREFERQREQEVARQADEDRTIGQLGDVLATQEGDPDPAAVESMIPGEVEQSRKGWMAKVALGQLPERKSRIEASKANAAWNKQLLQGEQRMDQIELTGAQAQERDALKFKRDSGRTLNPAEQAKLDAYERVADKRISAMDRRGSGGRTGGRISFTKVPTMRDGVSGTLLINQITGEERFEPAGPTAGTRGKEEAKASAMKAYEAIRGLRAQIPPPENWVEAGITGIGREIGARTQANPVANRYKASIRGFVPLLARALGHVGVLTELDVERTEDLFSGLGATAETDRISDEMMRGIMSGAQPFQFGQGGGKPIGYVDEQGNFTPMGGGEAPPAEAPRSGGGRTPQAGGKTVTYGGKRYRQKPGTDGTKRSHYEEIP